MASDPGTAVVGPWCRAEPVLWRRTLDGVVLLEARAEAEPVVLRGPAAAIWELLAQPMDDADLVATLATSYGVDRARVAPDVAVALATLADLGALQRC